LASFGPFSLEFVGIFGDFGQHSQKKEPEKLPLADVPPQVV
jgi:hypothetical protein